MKTFNSRGKPQPERDDPRPLTSNAGLSFVGSYVLGMGFTLTPEERDELIKRNKKNGERIFPYLGGKEVNTSPTQAFHRYVINFGDMALEEAERWPDLIAIVREKVKPERDKLRDNSIGRKRREYWWRYGSSAPALYDAIRDLPRCLVNSQVSKHLIFAFQPTDRVFSHALYAYPLPHHTHFAILQSRVHEPWARLLSSTFGEGPRYAASNCFDTFPFPNPNPKESIMNLETIGQQVYEARAKYLIDHDIGLTIYYNRLKDPKNRDAEILMHRRLHEEMDRQVCLAYGWDDLAQAVPPFEVEDAAWKDEVIDRLYLLNAERAAEESKE